MKQSVTTSAPALDERELAAVQGGVYVPDPGLRGTLDSPFTAKKYFEEMKKRFEAAKNHVPYTPSLPHIY